MSWWEYGLRKDGFTITPAGGLAKNEPGKSLSVHPLDELDGVTIVSFSAREEAGLTAYAARVLWDGMQYTGFLEVYDGGGRAKGHTILTGRAATPQDVFGGMLDVARRWCEGG